MNTCRSARIEVFARRMACANALTGKFLSNDFLLPGNVLVGGLPHSNFLHFDRYTGHDCSIQSILAKARAR